MNNRTKQTNEIHRSAGEYFYGKVCDTHKLREKSGKRPYKAPTLKVHPVSGLTPAEVNVIKP